MDSSSLVSIFRLSNIFTSFKTNPNIINCKKIQNYKLVSTSPDESKLFIFGLVQYYKMCASIWLRFTQEISILSENLHVTLSLNVNEKVQLRKQMIEQTDNILSSKLSILKDIEYYRCMSKSLLLKLDPEFILIDKDFDTEICEDDLLYISWNTLMVTFESRLRFWENAINVYTANKIYDNKEKLKQYMCVVCLRAHTKHDVLIYYKSHHLISIICNYCYNKCKGKSIPISAKVISAVSYLDGVKNIYY